MVVSDVSVVVVAVMLMALGLPKYESTASFSVGHDGLVASPQLSPLDEVVSITIDLGILSYIFTEVVDPALFVVCTLIVSL